MALYAAGTHQLPSLREGLDLIALDLQKERHIRAERRWKETPPSVSAKFAEPAPSEMEPDGRHPSGG